MGVVVGLDVTKKHYTNHSIRKTTLKKLKKAGVRAIEQSLAIRISNYDELDDEDHLYLSRILSSEMATSKQLTQRPLSDHTTHIQSPTQLNPPISTPNYVMPSAPVYNVQNSIIIFGPSSSSSR